MASSGTTNGGVPSSSPMTTSAAGAMPTSMSTVGSSSLADNTASSPAALSSNSAAASGIHNGAATSAAATSMFKKRKYVAFWDVDGPGVDAWIGTIGGPFQNNGTSQATCTADGGDNNNAKDGTTTKVATPNQGTYASTSLYCTIPVLYEYANRSILNIAEWQKTSQLHVLDASQSVIQILMQQSVVTI